MHRASLTLLAAPRIERLAKGRCADDCDWLALIDFWRDVAGGFARDTDLGKVVRVHALISNC